MRPPARASRAPAGVVAVEAEDHRIGEAEQLLDVVGRAGRAQRGDRIAEAALGQRHDVHVTLDHQAEAAFADRLPGLEQAVQLAALAEHRVSGEFRYLGLLSSSTRAPKPMISPPTARIGNITRWRNQS
jgi:hypothetical protein